MQVQVIISCRNKTLVKYAAWFFLLRRLKSILRTISWIFNNVFIYCCQASAWIVTDSHLFLILGSTKTTDQEPPASNNQEPPTTTNQEPPSTANQEQEKPATDCPVRLEYATSKYGRPVILLGEDGRFNFCSQKGSKTSWRCVKWSHGCRATLTTVDNVLVKFPDKHKHSRHND